MNPRAFAVVLGLTVAACGGGGSLGSPSQTGGILEGAYRGSIEFYTPTPRTVAATFTFRTMPQTSGTTYDATAAWAGVTTRAMHATLTGDQFSTMGVFPSVMGCDGDVWSQGTADARTIDATFNGSSRCEPAWTGHMLLKR